MKHLLLKQLHPMDQIAHHFAVLLDYLLLQRQLPLEWPESLELLCDPVVPKRQDVVNSFDLHQEP